MYTIGRISRVQGFVCTMIVSPSYNYADMFTIVLHVFQSTLKMNNMYMYVIASPCLAS